MYQFYRTVIAYIFLLLLSTHLIGQVRVQVNQLIHTDSNAVVYVQGDIALSNQGKFSHKGNLFLTGNWSNQNQEQGFTTDSDGTIVFDGQGQDIYGPQATTFPTVVLRGTGIKRQFSPTIKIKDSLALRRSEWATHKNILCLSNPMPQSLSRDEFGGFISADSLQGGFYREMKATEPYLFPLGSNGTVFGSNPRYRPLIAIPKEEGTLAAGARFANIDPSLDRTDGGDGFNREIFDGEEFKINARFYHNIYRNEGETPIDWYIYYSPGSDGSYDDMVQWQEDMVWSIIASDPNEINGNTPGTDGLSHYAYLPSVRDYDQSPIALVRSNYQPVDVLNFNAVLRGADGLLTWNTLYAVNGRRFEIERSIDGLLFQVIGKLPGSGQEGNNYNYLDRNITDLGVDSIFYRIRQIDAEGEFFYSEVRVLSIVDIVPDLFFLIYPNPAKDKVKAAFSNPIGDLLELSIFDLHGKQLFTELILDKEQNTLNIDISQLSRGIYAFVLQSKVLVNSSPGLTYTNRIKAIRVLVQ